MHLLVTQEAHLACANQLSPMGAAMIHRAWPQTAQAAQSMYLLHIPEELGRDIGSQLPQQDADLLVSLWPELNHFLEGEMEVG